MQCDWSKKMPPFLYENTYLIGYRSINDKNNNKICDCYDLLYQRVRLHNRLFTVTIAVVLITYTVNCKALNNGNLLNKIILLLKSKAITVYITECLHNCSTNY